MDFSFCFETSNEIFSVFILIQKGGKESVEQFETISRNLAIQIFGPTVFLKLIILKSPEFGRSVNPIQTRGADYAPHTAAHQPPPGFKKLSTPLRMISILNSVKARFGQI